MNPSSLTQKLLTLALAACAMAPLLADPDQIGDLDQDGRYTVRDVARIVNHIQRREFIPAALQPFADINGDRTIDRRDVDRLIAAILEREPIDAIPLARPLETSPADGEGSVALTRESVVRFSLPLADTAILDHTNFYATFGGRKILSRVEISSDRLKASLFYLENLPASARVRVTLLGDALRDSLGRLVDADRNGQPGGTLVFDFDTASVTPVPNTGVIGVVYASEAGGESGDVPLPGVIIEVVGDEERTRTVTAADGTFRLQPVPAGRFFVNIDGRMVTGLYPNGDYYPFVGKTWAAVAGNPDNLANGTGEIFLPLVKSGSLKVTSPTTQTTVEFPPTVLAGNPGLAGTEILVPPNSLFANDGTRGGRVGIAPVAPDRLPEPLPAGLQLPLVITIQTDGATNFDVPVPVRLPNLPDPVTGRTRLPGESTALWSFNHDTGEWEIAGPMTVTPDGLWLVTDMGVGVRQPGWHGAADGTTGGGGNPQGSGSGNGNGDGGGDNDGDGIPNGEDDDVDGDGIPNGEDGDVDGDGIPNGEDGDVDGDGIPNGEDGDVDGDGVPNGEDGDADGDGISNEDDPDVDGDGISNEEDTDDDGDGTPDEEDTDDDGDGLSDNCTRECLESGDLSNLAVNVVGPATVCKGDLVRFEAAGVVDSGGTLKVVCKDDEGNVVSETEEDIPPGGITYDWVVTHDGAVVASGSGSSAVATASSTGTYTVSMTATVDRRCLTKTVNLTSASVNVVDRANFTAYTFSESIPQPTPLIQRLQDTLNRIPRVTVKLEPTVGLAAEAGRRDCCSNGQLRENGEYYVQMGLGVAGSVEGQVWGPPTIYKQFDWGFANGTVAFKAGLFINTSVSFGGTAGSRRNECKSEQCIYGELKAGVEITTQVKFEAFAVAWIFGQEYALDDIKFAVTAPLKVGVSGAVKYNANDNCDGFSGSFGMDDIVFVFQAELAGVALGYQHVIWESDLKLSTPSP